MRPQDLERRKFEYHDRGGSDTIEAWNVNGKPAIDEFDRRKLQDLWTTWEDRILPTGELTAVNLTNAAQRSVMPMVELDQKDSEYPIVMWFLHPEVVWAYTEDVEDNSESLPPTVFSIITNSTDNTMKGPRTRISGSVTVHFSNEDVHDMINDGDAGQRPEITIEKGLLYTRRCIGVDVVIDEAADALKESAGLGTLIVEHSAKPELAVDKESDGYMVEFTFDFEM